MALAGMPVRARMAFSTNNGYLNWWLTSIDAELVEGIHYSTMFYGGRLASHLSGDDPDTFVDDFISLRRLNRRGVILIDSDSPLEGVTLNNTKQGCAKNSTTGQGMLG